ncbi:hypothetical protein E1287_25785 [Actinomadura sp. KC06]|uniref:hypothetical protein n=1 Tax=Actinomadura sp. KC06 TaxID=2530369 RepID=UPI00104E155D|nr:hypothetical protein [Actinomadura sp. KC06]TDD31675.1 hypothetical protein E1287_25785 [Actinomadura sp. KC06]
MRSGNTQYTQAHKALNDIGVLTDHGSAGRDFAIVSLDWLYRPARNLVWKRGTGWKLSIDGRAYADSIPIGPPDMRPGKAARACARLLTEQNRRQREAIESAVRDTFGGETLSDLLGWQAADDLRAPILKAFRADVLAEQDGDGRD